jgi:uncharacterized protein YndB with AHSA1/START domain
VLDDDTPALRLTTPDARQIVMSREFAAPRALVFDAWTKPHLLRRWYGARGWTLVTCEIDPRPGGAWRYVSHGPNGAVMTQQGTFREFVPPERLVTTQTFDSSPGDAETLVTTTFVETAGVTTVTLTAVYPTRAARDEALRTPMRRGVAQGFARLDTLLAALDPSIPRSPDP